MVNDSFHEDNKKAYSKEAPAKPTVPAPPAPQKPPRVFENTRYGYDSKDREKTSQDLTATNSQPIVRGQSIKKSYLVQDERPSVAPKIHPQPPSSSIPNNPKEEGRPSRQFSPHRRSRDFIRPIFNSKSRHKPLFNPADMVSRPSRIWSPQRTHHRFYQHDRHPFVDHFAGRPFAGFSPNRRHAPYYAHP
jgi:hypothetical protein